MWLLVLMWVLKVVCSVGFLLVGVSVIGLVLGVFCMLNDCVYMKFFWGWVGIGKVMCFLVLVMDFYWVLF